MSWPIIILGIVVMVFGLVMAFTGCKQESDDVVGTAIFIIIAGAMTAAVGSIIV